jgi:rhodanese-related sulfurtransferase/DNA-binding transcriptional ArsR family regulator
MKTSTTSKRQFKDAIYEQFSRIGKAVSSAKRLELLDLLCQGARTVEALAAEAELSIANTSQHLQVLRTARLVEASKEGLYVTYRIADAAVGDFVRTIRVLAEKQLAEVERISLSFFEGRRDLQPIDRDALVKRVRKGEVIVLDVRPAAEYSAGHIPGALSIPIQELKRRLSELPKSKRIVAYCRGPYCVFSDQAVELLRAKGFQAVRLDEGILDWRARGLPVAVGEPS